MTDDGPFPDRDLSRDFERLRTAIPAVTQHRQALKLLGADFRFIRKYTDGSWVTLVDPGEGLAGRFGLTRDMMLIYSPDHELQPSILPMAQRRRDDVPRNFSAEDHFVLVASVDAHSAQKLRAWAQSEPMLGIYLPPSGQPEAIARSLAAEMQRTLASRNLYDETLPVTGPDFFGRRTELTNLQEELRQGKVCGVFGLRKTGKTSLVKELGRRFVAGSSDRIFVLRDLESLPQQGGRLRIELVQDLRQGLLEAFRSKQVRRGDLADLELDASVGDFKRALATSLNDCARREIQVVLALDEIESLLGDAETLRTGSRPEVPEMLGALRSLVQEHSIFNVVLSGITSAIIHRGELYGTENPLFNWARSYYVHPMSKVEINGLTTDVGRRMGVHWSADGLDQMYRTGIGDVFLHRTLAAVVVGALDQEMFPMHVSSGDVSAVQRKWRRGVAERLGQMFASFERHYPTEASLLRLVAAGDADWASLEVDYPVEVGRLIDLALVSEPAGGGKLTFRTALSYVNRGTGFAMTVGLDWYPELASLFSRPASLAFTHIGAVHCTTGFNAETLANERTASQHFELAAPSLRQWAVAASRGQLAIISPGDPTTSHRSIEASLHELREPLAAARTRGASMWFMSEYPLSRFPVLAASSLLADAETVRLKLVSDEFAIGRLLPIVDDSAVAERLAGFARGSRALLHAFAQVERLTCSGNEKLRRARQVESEIADRACDQLGPDLLSLVDSWVYESRLEMLAAEDVPNEAILSGLIASGIVRLLENDSIHVLPFVNRQLWVDALGSAVSRCVEAPESWMRVAAELFALERRLRTAISSRLKSDHGEGWKSQALEKFADGLVELARRDGIATATTTDRLRSPLDWLQLSDLLSLAADLSAGQPVMGLRPEEWRRVEGDVLHIRHRVAHMRLLRAGDLERVRRARRFMDLRSVL